MMISIRRLKMRLYFWCLAIYMFIRTIRIRLRKIFKLNGYTKLERLEIGEKYINLIELMINQNINVIFSVVGLFNKLRKINKKIFKNYVEIYIKTNVQEIIKKKKKKKSL